MAQRGPHIQLNLKFRRKEELGKKGAHFPRWTERVREERKGRAKSFLPRSKEFHWSVFVRTITKFYRIDEGYAWVPKKKDFIEYPRREFWEIEVVEFRRLPSCVSMLQEVKDSSYLVLLSIFGPGKEGFSLRACLAKKKTGFSCSSQCFFS